MGKKNSTKGQEVKKTRRECGSTGMLRFPKEKEEMRGWLTLERKNGPSFEKATEAGRRFLSKYSSQRLGEV